jgi:hypothetical protein
MKIAVAALVVALLATVSAAQAPANRMYVWSGQVTSIDKAAKAVTFRLAAKDFVARYIKQVKPGDMVIMYWSSPKPGETDALIDVSPYDVAQRPRPDDFGYVFHAQFVSFDSTSMTVTVTAHLRAAAFAKFAAIQPGQWVKVTSPMDQSKDLSGITGVQVSTNPGPHT